MRARAPASSANLGPGFDALALALALYVEVTVEPADRLSVSSSGEGSGLPADRSHLAARVAVQIAGHDRLAITVRSDIPVGRGLGSSAALAVAAAAAAGADRQAAFRVGAEVDGHPENAAASAMGGLVAAAVVDGRPLSRHLPLDRHLAFVLVVPDRGLPTAEARQVLPASVAHADAAFNLGRMGLLVAGLADHHQLIAAATGDRLHQAARAALFPGADRLLVGLVEAGALASCWSGAGPALLALCADDDAAGVAAAATQLLAKVGLPGRVLSLAPDSAGVAVTE